MALLFFQIETEFLKLKLNAEGPKPERPCVLPPNDAAVAGPGDGRDAAVAEPGDGRDAAVAEPGDGGAAVAEPGDGGAAVAAAADDVAAAGSPSPGTNSIADSKSGSRTGNTPDSNQGSKAACPS